MVNSGLRTKKTYLKYIELQKKGLLLNGCRLCKKPKSIKEFKYWRITHNSFPWDLVSRTNYLLIPKRHTVYSKLNSKEKKEFDLIKATYVGEHYEIMLEVTDKMKSIPSHFHVHLINLKKKLNIV